MLDCEVVLAGPGSEGAAKKPAAREARIERERTIDQPDCGIDILIEASQHQGRVDENARVVLSRLKRLPGQIAGLAADCRYLLDPAVGGKLQVADRGKCRPVMPIDR